MLHVFRAVRITESRNQNRAGCELLRLASTLTWKKLMEEFQVIFQPSVSLLFRRMSWPPSTQIILYAICLLVVVFASLVLTHFLLTGLCMTWTVMAKSRCIYQIRPYYTQLESKHYFIRFMYVSVVFLLQYEVNFFFPWTAGWLWFMFRLWHSLTPGQIFVELCPDDVIWLLFNQFHYCTYHCRTTAISDYFFYFFLEYFKINSFSK